MAKYEFHGRFQIIAGLKTFKRSIFFCVIIPYHAVTRYQILPCKLFQRWALRSFLSCVNDGDEGQGKVY